jgi:hypothetical protein
MADQISNFVSRLVSPRRLLAVAGTLTALSSLSCISPEVANKAGANFYPLAPGNQPFVLVTLINSTTASLDVTIEVDTGSSTPVPYFFQNITPGLRTQGVLLPYPFLRVSLGDPDSPFTPSIRATLPNNLTVEVPFGQPALVAGTDFQKGDTIIFDFVADARSNTAISVSTGIVPASTQLGPFSRANTFATVTALLAINGVDVTSLTGTTQ